MKYTFDDLDERIVKTRIALSGAIFEIIKSNKSVKVLDICKEADITPMTYYHHFNNKTQLLQFAVKGQLENILPIPRKLKPINMRQLVGYLLKAFISFVDSHKEIIKVSIEKIRLNAYKNTYIDVLLQTTKYLIYHEIKSLENEIDQNTLNIWTNTITYGLFMLLLDRTNRQLHNEFYLIWNPLRKLWNKI